MFFDGVDKMPIFATCEIDYRVSGTWYCEVNRNINDYFRIQYHIRTEANHPEPLKAADAAVVRYVQSITTLEHHRSSK
jgi:hypothetical protein